MKVSVVKNLDALIEDAIRRIDSAAHTERLQHITPNMDGIYLEKRREAQRYIADGSPSDLSEYPFLANEVGVTAPTAYELAQLWLNLDHLWRHIAAEIENRRLSAKNAARAATNPAEVEAAINSFSSSE